MAYTPKNIRQIGGREDRCKVYMEDYVNTYLRRIQETQEENGMAGVLVGSTEESIFISGAMALPKADLNGGRVYLSQDAWTECYEILGTYFSGQDLCGIFVCEGSCRRFRRQALFGVVREMFPDKEALLYLLTEDGEEILYRVSARGEERLQGYYCYFERNEAMQEYMMDNLPQRRVEWEETYQRKTAKSWQAEESHQPVFQSEERSPGDLYRSYRQGKEGSLGDPVHSFRRKMDQQKGRQKESPVAQKSGRSIVALCAVMAVVIFVSGLGLVYREQGGVQMKDLLERLHIDPSRLAAVSAWPDETGERYEESGDEADRKEGDAVSEQAGTGSGVVVEEIPGNVFPTEPVEESTEPSLAEETVLEETVLEESMAEETMTESASQGAIEESPTDPEEEEVTLTLPVGTGVIYVVRAGDSLYSISRRFYGTDEMVSVIQQLNELSNADLIKEGQELLLP